MSDSYGKLLLERDVLGFDSLGICRLRFAGRIHTASHKLGQAQNTPLTLE